MALAGVPDVDPAEVLAQDGAFRLIRRRETFEDLVATEMPE